MHSGGACALSKPPSRCVLVGLRSPLNLVQTGTAGSLRSRGSPTHRDLAGGLPALGLVRKVAGGHEETQKQAVVLLVVAIVAHCGEKAGSWSPLSEQGTQAPLK